MSHFSFTFNGEEISRQALAAKSLDFIADSMASLPATSSAYRVFDSELERRRTEATIQAADAAKSSALSQARSTKYVLWTVIAMFATSLVQVAASVLLFFFSK